MTRTEQETLIRWDAGNGTVHVWTCEPKTLRKLARLGYRSTKRQGPGAWFVLEKRAVTLRRPRSRPGLVPE